MYCLHPRHSKQQEPVLQKARPVLTMLHPIVIGISECLQTSELQIETYGFHRLNPFYRLSNPIEHVYLSYSLITNILTKALLCAPLS